MLAAATVSLTDATAFQLGYADALQGNEPLFALTRAESGSYLEGYAEGIADRPRVPGYTYPIEEVA